jgi:Ca2+/Na+ antiporter
MGSMIAARAGEADMAIANAIGSNVFDILLGLGLPFFIKSMLSGKSKVTNKNRLDLLKKSRLEPPCPRTQIVAGSRGGWFLRHRRHFVGNSSSLFWRGEVLFFFRSVKQILTSIFVLSLGPYQVAANKFRMNRTMGLALFLLYIFFIVWTLFLQPMVV